MKFNQIENQLNKNNSTSDVAPPSEICVDMHCHSSFSDGILSPKQVAKLLSDAGAKYAALTDHDTMEGLPAFRRALMKHGVGFIPGVEITALHNDHVLHLLAYGFDLDFAELKKLLGKPGNNAATDQTGQKLFLSSSEVIDLVHRAGGIVVFAHPFQTQPDISVIRVLVSELKELGLDGIEVYYGSNSADRQRELQQIAKESKLIASAGTDYHKLTDVGPGITIDLPQWKTFRDALLKTSPGGTQSASAQLQQLPKKRQKHWLAFLGNIIFPAILTLVLFVVALSVFLMPYFEETLIERKRENIRQLTQVVWSVLDEATEGVQNGRFSLEEAQTLVKTQISAMRYGPENKDYFWIQDTSPKIIMHPYRTDLDDQDVSDFQDAQGTKIFVAFSDLALDQGEGYVSYVWQWHDETDRLEPKESYIRFFEPWDWVIGTGLYINDVQAEIDSLQSNIIKISAGVIFIVMILMLYLIKQGMLIEKSRSEAEKLLVESTVRYRALSEAATEGALFVHDGRCRYANAVMYELLGCGTNKIELLDLHDVFPDIEVNRRWLQYLGGNRESEAPGQINGVIRRCNGTLLSCNMSVKNGLNDTESGCMILVRRSVDLSEHTGTHVALNRLLHIPSSIATDLADSIRNAAQINEVVALSKKKSGLVVSLLENGTSSIAIAYMISIISDLVTQKIIELSIKDIGAPPVTFAFLALGSHGRQSQTLFSDQDNAIIYQLTGEEDEKAVQKYFLKLATKVCDDLELAGYKKCIGDMIASNPKWCQPLSVWKSYFAEWIRKSEPQEIVEFSIMFDFRPVSGNSGLTSELRDFIYSEIKNDAFFLTCIAQNALLFKTPMRLFGSILSSGGKGIDVKRPAMAIVGFARLYAMKNAIGETNTLLQLDAIKGLGIILDSKHRDIVTAYEILVRLRLWDQVLAIEYNEQLDNFIEPSQLGQMEEVVLRESFKEIDKLQGLIQRDFLA